MYLSGWSDSEIDELRHAGTDELGRRFGVVPAELIERAGSDLTSMVGRFDVDGDAVRFRPRYPFAAGTTYAWVFRESTPVDCTDTLTIARPATTVTAATAVTAIYPSTFDVPFNLLRFYIHFSAPMSEGFAARSIELQVSDTGEILDDAILALEPEMWDPTRHRLTLLLDPGRIKRGLVPNAEVGYPLVSGQLVSLVVNATFRDAAGAALRDGARRDYVVGAALRRRVDPADWTFAWPAALSRQPVIIEFDRPLDHALVRRCLSVLDSSAVAVAGEIAVAPGERQWRFTPDTPWAACRYTVAVQSELEDVAGNSVARVFDRDLDRRQDDPIEAEVTNVDFVCG